MVSEQTGKRRMDQVVTSWMLTDRNLPGERKKKAFFFFVFLFLRKGKGKRGNEAPGKSRIEKKHGQCFRPTSGNRSEA